MKKQDILYAIGVLVIFALSLLLAILTYGNEEFVLVLLALPIMAVALITGKK